MAVTTRTRKPRAGRSTAARPSARRAQAAASIATGFRAELERALEHFGDPAWLGAQSPLAAPYVLLGDAAQTPGAISSDEARGALLQRLVREAAAGLQSAANADLRGILDALYLAPQRHMNQAGIATRMGISPATFYRYRLEALDQLEAALATRLQPAVRPETPALRALVGRDAPLQRCLAQLRAGRRVGVSGASGVGKSALAGQVAAEWASTGPAFWHTFRTGVNDHVDSLLFALGDYCRLHGAPALWSQLLASRDKLDGQLAMSLAWSCLAQIAQTRAPLLCFDEIDVLAPGMAEPEPRTALRHFVEGLLAGLPAGLPVLLIGQHVLFEPEEQIHLAGLAAEDARALLAADGLLLTGEDQARVLAYTRGNPLLLRLFRVLYAPDRTVAQTLAAMPGEPTLSILLSRVLRRLDGAARQVLLELSVFDDAAPADAWREQAAALTELVDRGLAQDDGRGAVALQTALREVVLRQMDADARLRCHRWAAEVRAARGEFTAAARHLVLGEQVESAVRLWFAHREREIARGRASAALAVFAAVARDGLDADTQRQLVLIRAELRALSGESAQALDDLNAVRWRDADVHAPRAHELRGDMLVRLGQTAAGQAAYRAGLTALDAQLARKRVQLHVKRGSALVLERDLAAAEKEAALARVEAAWLTADILDERGEYSAAAQQYAQALATAEAAGDAAVLARAHFGMAKSRMRLEDPAGALPHFEAALAHFRATGNLLRLHQTESNMAFMFIQAGQDEAALAPAERALAFGESVGQAELIATNASNLAEAYANLGRLDEAWRMAEHALRQEDVAVRPYALTVLGRVQLARAQAGEARDTLRAAVDSAREALDVWAEAPAQRALAQALAAVDARQEARAALMHAAQLYRDLALPREVARTEALIDALSLS